VGLYGLGAPSLTKQRICPCQNSQSLEVIRVQVTKNLGILAHSTYCWAMTRKSYNYSGNCAHADRVPVLVEGLNMILEKTSATKSNIFWRGGGREFWLNGCLGSESRKAQSHRLKASENRDSHVVD
jgi:hypothetical protein